MTPITKPEPGKAAAAPSFLTPDDRIPASVRALLLETDGCMAGGFFTGATACAQRALEALLKMEKAEGDSHQARVRALGDKTPGLPQLLLTVLTQLGDVTARETTKLATNTLQLLVTTLKATAYEIYVVGPERAERLQYVHRLLDATDRAATERATADRATAVATADRATAERKATPAALAEMPAPPAAAKSSLGLTGSSTGGL